jgi:lipoprotein LpqB-like beta-propeller protein
MARLLLTILLLISGAAAAGTPTRISAESFAALPSATTARISPDGTRIAAVGSGKESDYIFIVDPDAPSKVLRRINIGKTGLGDLRWANDDRLILSLYNQFNFLGLAFRSAKILVVDITSGEVVVWKTRPADSLRTR